MEFQSKKVLEQYQLNDEKSYNFLMRGVEILKVLSLVSLYSSISATSAHPVTPDIFTESPTTFPDAVNSALFPLSIPYIRL